MDRSQALAQVRAAAASTSRTLKKPVTDAHTSRDSTDMHTWHARMRSFAGEWSAGTAGWGWG